MNFKYENKKIEEGYSSIIGCDEVGRGCLAGPVVAAAALLRPEFLNHKSSILNLKDVKDSKLLTAGKREELSKTIKNLFLWSIAEVSSEAVDEINIHNASLLAMKKAVEGLLTACVIPETLSASERLSGIQKSAKTGSRLSAALGRDDTSKAFLFVDGKFPVPNLNNIEQEAIIGGDNKVLSIAAASIIAKVYRDELMQKFDQQYPKYNLAQHKGYATLHHRQMIIQNGLSPIHRLSFCQNLSV